MIQIYQNDKKEIADLFEEELSVIQRIYNTLEEHTEWEDSEVYRELES